MESVKLACQHSFQHWVAFVRIGSPDVSPMEQLICPLMCCRCRFNDIPTTLNHVFRCPWIGDGWYWCPFCSQPENIFAISGHGDNRRPRRELLLLPLKRKLPIFRDLAHRLMPWITLSMHLPSEVDVSPNERSRWTRGLGSAPELEAYVAEMPANDPRWYFPEAGGVDRQELEASSRHPVSSRAADSSISPATYPLMHTLSQTSENTKSMQKQFAELQKINPVGCRQWLSRHATDRELLEMCCKASPSMVFEKGIFFLDSLIDEKLLLSLEEVYAFVHILLGVTYICHRHDESPDWKHFIWDLGYWQHIIADRVKPQLASDASDQLRILGNRALASSSRASFSSKFRDHSSIRPKDHSCKPLNIDRRILLPSRAL